MVIWIQSSDSAFEMNKIVSICLQIKCGKDDINNVPVKSNIHYTYM